MSKVIKKDNLEKIFKELDQRMSDKGRKETLIIFGSAAFMAQGYSDGSRMTYDVDVVKPPFDNELWVLSAEAGEKFELDMGWLNAAGNIFSRNFPEGWEDRTKEVFKGEALTIQSLGRQDLICTKFNALCDRVSNTDRVDMKSINPTKKELEVAKEWVISLKPELKPMAEKIISQVFEKDRGRGR